MRFGIDNYGLGLGDVLIFSMFLIAAYKAYGRRAAWVAFGLILGVGGVVTSFVPFLANFLDTQLDLLVPAQTFFGPAAFLCYLWLRRRYGRERTMAEYWASLDTATSPAAVPHAEPHPGAAREPVPGPAPEPALPRWPAFDRRQGLNRVPGWRYLTGTPAQIRRIWQEYGITAARSRYAAFVIDPAGRVRQEFRHDPGPGTAAISSSFAVLFADSARQALSER